MRDKLTVFGVDLAVSDHIHDWHEFLVERPAHGWLRAQWCSVCDRREISYPGDSREWCFDIARLTEQSRIAVVVG